MKLLNQLYRILELSGTDAGFSASIQLDPEHIIFSGHFPGHPVMPGVVQLQLVHELSEHYFGKRIRLLAIFDCKFLKILNPGENNLIQMEVACIAHEHVVQIKATGKTDTGVFFKLKADYCFV